MPSSGENVVVHVNQGYSEQGTAKTALAVANAPNV